MFQKSSGSEKVYGYQGGGSIKIFFESILSHSAEICRRGIVQSFFNFVYRIDLDERVGGRVSRFSVETFLSHNAKKFRRATL